MRSAAALVIVAFVVGATAPRASDAQSTAPAPLAIPFELVTRHIIVQVSVNKSRPLAFVLDTGANQAIVRMDVAKELGLSLIGSVSAGGAGAGRQTGQRVEKATWSLVGLERVTQPVALALPMPELSPALGRDVDGIIGGEFIKQFVVEVDYQARFIRLHDPRMFEYHGAGEAVSLEFNPSGHPVVNAIVTPQGARSLERSFMFDIGSGAALVLHSPFVTEQRLPGPDVKTIRAIGGAGAGGRTAGRLGRVTALKIGSFVISHPITLFSEDKAGAFADPVRAGNIGARIASRFRIFFDYGRRRMILEPSPTFAEPFDYAFSGIALRAERPDYHTFRVREVLEESPATEAGLAVGDVIVSIDGAPAERLTLSAINEMLEKPVTRELVIRRGEQTIRTTLTPKRFI